MKIFSSRLAKLDDLEQLIALRVLMQKEVNGIGGETIDASYLESLKQYFSRSLQDGSYISAVATVGDKLVGATGLVIYEKPPSLKGRNGKQGYISNVYTLPEWRGKGVATDLMKLTVISARSCGADKLFLGTRDSAKGVYERIGFKPTHLPHLELNL